MKRTQVLVLEEKSNIRQLIHFSLSGEFNFEVLDCDNFNEAEQILEQYNNELKIVFVGEVSESKKLYEFYEKFVNSKINSVFITVKQNNIESWISRFEKVIDCVIENKDIFKPLNQFIKEHFQIDQSVEPEEYTKIPFSSLKYLDGLQEDAYIQLKTKRKLKIFRKGDVITDDDITKYAKKNVQSLFIHKTAYKWILEAIESNVENLLRNPDEKVTLTAPSPEITTEHISLEELNEITNEVSNEIEPKVKLEENQKAKKTEELVRPFQNNKEMLELVGDKTKKITKFLKKDRSIVKCLKNLNLDREDGHYLKNRIGLVSNISCFLAKELDWDSDKTYEKLIYVAYTHDMPLFDNLTLCKIQTLKELNHLFENGAISEEEKKRVLEHPREAEAIITKDLLSPQEAGLIVLQHHERPDRSGFPDKIPAQRIVAFSAIISVSIHFAQYILENENWNINEYLEKAWEDFKGGNHSKVLRALENLAKNNISID